MLCQGIEERLSELYVLQILCSAAQPHTVRPFKIMQKLDLEIGPLRTEREHPF